MVRAVRQALVVLTRLVRWRRSGVVDWSVDSGNREEGGASADFRANA